MKLCWYKNIEPLLKLDNIYHLDHVTAHQYLSTSSSKPPNSNAEENKTSTYIPIFDNLSSLVKAKPLPSKKFRVEYITNTLRNHFIQSWEHEKCNSSKLSFYNIHKIRFEREIYIDEVKGFSRRYNTTQLRISAHELEIERGRYTKTPKESRICHWCNTSMGVKTVENENHVLFECDLYANLRSKLITRLNKAPKITDIETNLPTNLIINNTKLQENFMNMLPPFSVSEIKDDPIDEYN